MKNIDDLSEAVELSENDEIIFVRENGYVARISLADFALHAPEIPGGEDPDPEPGNDYDHLLEMEPVALYDVSVADTLAQDDAGTLPVTSQGDPVALLMDLSGNDNHGSTTISNQRALYQIKGDGTFALRFDGSNDRLNVPGLDTLFNNTNTWWAAFAAEQISLTGSGFVFLGKRHQDSPRTSTHFWQGFDGDGDWIIIERVLNGSFVGPWVADSKLEIGNRSVAIGYYNGTQLSVQVPPATPVTSADSRSLGTGNVVPTHIGGDAVTGMVMDVFAAVIFDKIPSPEDQTTVIAWLQSKITGE